MWKRWRPFAVRVVIAALIAWIVATAPIRSIAPQNWVAFVQVPIVIFVFICYIGKLLIDTLFYNHYKY